jgi:enamine deaminase RidA (YjgF/YER057c/UK114 family)
MSAMAEPDAQGPKAGPTPIEPDGWAPPKGYANGMLAPAGARILAVSGQVGWNERGEFESDDFVEQFARALDHVLAVVAKAGGRPEHLLRLVFYVTDREEYRRTCKAIGERYRQVLGRHYVACTLVEVKGLLEPRARIEIEATAAIPA